MSFKVLIYSRFPKAMMVRIGALDMLGIAGPTGGTEEKPVGLVYIAVSYGNKTESLECNFRGDRNRIRLWASQQALDLIRRKLM